MFSNIIAAVDGSDISFLALDRAIEIAKQNNAKLHAIYVIESHAMSSSPLDTSGDMHHRRLEKEAAETIEKVKKVAEEKQIVIDTHIGNGHPGDTVVNFAEKNGCDLIVAGSLGKSAFDRLLLGSVSGYMVKASKTNILIVRD